MGVEEGDARAHEHPDVAPALARGMPAVMHDAHGRHPCDPGQPGSTQAQVEILEIQEIARIEATQGLEHLGAKQHEAAADDRWIPEHGVGCLIAQLVLPQPAGEPATQPVRREPAQQQIEHRRVALAEKFWRPVGIDDPRHQQPAVRMAVEEGERLDQRLGSQLDIGVQDQVQLAVAAVQRAVVAGPEADVAVAVMQLQARRQHRWQRAVSVVDELDAQPQRSLRRRPQQRGQRRVELLRIAAVDDDGDRHTLSGRRFKLHASATKQ